MNGTITAKEALTKIQDVLEKFIQCNGPERDELRKMVNIISIALALAKEQAIEKKEDAVG